MLFAARTEMIDVPVSYALWKKQKIRADIEDIHKGHVSDVMPLGGQAGGLVNLAHQFDA